METGNRNLARPVRVVQKVDPSRVDPWDHLPCDLASPEACPLGQAWRDEPEAGFQPGSVAISHTGQDLLVTARLTGPDIGNPVTGHNQLAFLAGDVFEVFLQPRGCDAYLEVHVTPNNDRLELLFPSAAAREQRVHLADLREQLEPFLVDDSGVSSRVRIASTPERWEVLVRIPFGTVTGGFPVPESCRFSCCRYDYRLDRPDPILSSTSPHAVCNFHRRDEWGELRLQGGVVP